MSKRRARRYRRLALLFLVPFLILAVLVRIDSATLMRWDQAATAFFVSLRTPTLTGLMMGFTGMAGIPFLILLVILTFLGMLKLTNHRVVSLWFVGTVFFGAVFMNPVLKLLFGRARPDQAIQLVQETTNSFPSGHSIASILVYGAFVYAYYYLSEHRSGWGRRQTFLKVLAVFMGIIVAISRVYLGAHHLSDVIAGLSLGAAILYGSLSLTVEFLAKEQETRNLLKAKDERID